MVLPNPAIESGTGGSGSTGSGSDVELTSVNDRQASQLGADTSDDSSYNARERHGLDAPNTHEADNTVIVDRGGRDRASPARTSAGTGPGPPIHTGEGGSPEPDPGVSETVQREVDRFMTNEQGQDVAETTAPPSGGDLPNPGMPGMPDVDPELNVEPDISVTPTVETSELAEKALLGIAGAAGIGVATYVYNNR